MKNHAPTLYAALSAFLGPLVAEYGRLVEDGDPALPVSISFGGYTYRTTLAVLQDLDRAHGAAFDAKQHKAANKAAKRRVGALL